MEDLITPTRVTQRQCILLVDDDASIRQLVKDKLEYDGFQVLAADSANQAIDLINHHGLPHLVIVDLIMPGMDGFEFCRRMQEFTDLPAIILTAIDEEETVIKGIERYAEDYVV